MMHQQLREAFMFLFGLCVCVCVCARARMCYRLLPLQKQALAKPEASSQTTPSAKFLCGVHI